MVNSKNVAMPKISKKINVKNDDKPMKIISYIFVIAFAMICVFPFLYVVSMSFTSYQDYLHNPLRFLPGNIDLAAYKKILGFRLIYSGYRATLFITVIGTLINIFLLVFSAYPLTKKELKGRKVILALITFTMFFNGGMIPNFILIRQLGLYNSLWSQILPGALSAFNLILMKNFIQSSIPQSLEEAAIIDGANDFQVLRKIITPLSLPAIATFTVLCAVGHWNDYMAAVLYISDRKIWPLMVVLRELVIDDIQGMVGLTAAISNQQAKINPFTLKMATIVVTTLPILVVYPFVQKYFVSGMFIGSVKE